jgi:asparagine synthase (glutamine-hydrolysing)
MCGIAGEVRVRGQRPDEEAVRRMTAAQAARGPDGEGIWTGGSVSLGHRRLAIIDLSERGAQPMVDAELGLAVVFNGCIYNHRELRAELAADGYRFRSTSDTEVIPAAFHRWGDRFVEHLVGMFAIAVVDVESGRSVLARDRLGVKPLYLAEVGGALRFASSVPALLAGGDVDSNIDPVALHHYLSFHAVVPAPRTLLRGVRKLPPATVLVVEPDGRRHETRYWRPEGHDVRPADWQDATAEALRRAVERRLVADVPVGVLLSGGLDSSLIVGLLAEAGQQGLATFSIGFESAGGEGGDEFRWSDMVAERFGTDHRRFVVPTGDVVATVPATVAAMSEPMVSHDVVAFHLLSQEVAKHVKVVQSGQGADEVFAGYHWYQALAGAESDDLGSSVDAYLGVFADRTPDEIATVVADDLLVSGDLARAFVTEQFADAGADSALTRALRIDTTVMLVEDPVKRVDNMTMAWGLEARVPFLDHELVELAFACPPSLHVAGGGKGVLKALAREVLPAEVIDRPKGYFPVPPLVHLGPDAVGLLRDALCAPAARQRGIFRAGAVDELLADPNRLTRLRYNQLWELGMIELWLQTNGL